MKAINIPDAPAAIGPYCHAMKSGNLLFCSGQTPLDPDSMQIVGNNIQEQTKQVFNNIAKVLIGMDLELSNIVKTTVYLDNMDDFQGMNEVYEKELKGHKPARTTIAVKQNPLNALVEIECIAEIEKT